MTGGGRKESSLLLDFGNDQKFVRLSYRRRAAARSWCSWMEGVQGVWLAAGTREGFSGEIAYGIGVVAMHGFAPRLVETSWEEGGQGRTTTTSVGFCQPDTP
jgi:hypothetical protein